MHWLPRLALSLCVASLGCSATKVDVEKTEGLTGFEARLDNLRVELQIPGLSVAIAHDQKIVWSRGFGYADVRAGRRATAQTPYHLASLTKTFAATLVMQLVESGAVRLDDRIAKYAIDLPNARNIELRQLMSHTSEGSPGVSYHYNGNRFGKLDQVIEQGSGLTFAELLVERIIRPLGLRQTAPNVQATLAFSRTGLDRAAFEAELARAYGVEDGAVIEIEYPSQFNCAAGLIASVEDVARYSLAIDRAEFLQPATWEAVFTPARSPSGETLPYGLGWFIHQHQGLAIQWHYGWWTGNSSLIVRVPERKLTFVAAANTDAMSSRFGLGDDSDVMRSGVARLFIEAFVTGNEPFPNPRTTEFSPGLNSVH